MLLGEYGEHAVAKRTGFKVGDIVISFDGRTGRMSESEMLAYAVQRKRPGDEVTVMVLRNGEERVMRFALR
jgi:serine protease Do